MLQYNPIIIVLSIICKILRKLTNLTSVIKTISIFNNDVLYYCCSPSTTRDNKKLCKLVSLIFSTVYVAFLSIYFNLL